MGKIRTLIEGASNLEKLFQEEKAIASVAKKAKKEPSLPLDLTRAQPKTKQEISDIAERVARQQLGEHVRGATGANNLAGRSGAENRRIKETVYNLERTKQINPTKEVTGNVGDINQAVIGDTTISDFNLVDVNGIPIGSVQEGGPRYGLGQMDEENPFFWASNPGGAKPLQNKVNRLSELYDTDQIMGHHLSMGPTANNFAMHFADANMKAIHNSGTSPESMRIFNEIIRERHPDFPGVHKPQESMLAMKKDSDMRKYFNDRMKTPSITEALDMPNGLDIQWAITEPELRNLEIAMSGHSVGRLKPGAELIEGANHGTYSHGIQGEVLGHAPELAPFEVAYPDADMYLRSVYAPKQLSGTINMTAPHQKVDAQYLDQLNEYYKRLREIRGFKDGGEVEEDVQHFGKGGFAVELAKKMLKAQEEAKAVEAVKSTPSVSRIDMNYKDVTKRVPELTEAANLLDEGKLSASEYDKLVNTFKPVDAYSFVPSPATREDAMRALTKNKQPMYGMTSEIPMGEQTDLRLDIPAYKDHGVWVNSIHRKDAPTVYDSVSSVKNATMIGAPDKAIKVAKGGPKAPFAVIRGEWNPIEQEDAVLKAQEYMNHPEWTQVGYDPERHGYFYDRATMEPILGAEEVIQIGPLVLAKRPVYGAKKKQKYASGGNVDLEQEFVNADTIHMASGGKPKQDFSQPSLGSIAKTLYKTFSNNPQNRQLKETITGMNPIVREFNPFYTVPRGAEALSKVKGSPILKAARNEMFGIDDRKANREAIEQIMNTAEGIFDVLPVVGAAAIGAKPVMKGINKIADMNLPVGLSIKDVSEAKKAAEFRSSAAKSINSHKMESMPGPQWASWLQANGSKSAKKEAEATGLYDWLKTQPKVTKYDIEEHIGENLPKIISKDKAKPLQLTRAETDELVDLKKRHSSVLHGNKETPLTDEEMEKLMHYSDISEMATPSNLRHQAEKRAKSAQKMKDEGYSYTAFVEAREAEFLRKRAEYLESNPKVYGGSKWEQYTLPGGSNYRETMLSLPKTEKYLNRNDLSVMQREDFETYGVYDKNNNQVSPTFKTIDEAREWQRSPKVAGDNFDVPYSHGYGDPETDINRLAHLRMKDRVTPEGKKALFMEELQSDWAQQGRDRGFRQNIPKLTDAEENRYQTLLEDGRRNLQGDELAEFESLSARRHSSLVDSNIPSGPYVTDTKDWTALGLKHALKRAVDEGHDVMAWTTGQQQADRYKLSNYVNEIGHEKNPDGTYNMYAHGPDGDQVFLEEDMTIDRVKEVFGKDIANKVVAEEGVGKAPTYQLVPKNDSTSPINFATEDKAHEYATQLGLKPDFYDVNPVNLGYRDWKKLRGVNLDIGEESKGMKGYYDEIVPQTLNDVLKQIGATERVKPMDIVINGGIPRQMSADELLKTHSPQLNPFQRSYLEDFSKRWDSADEAGHDLTPLINEYQNWNDSQRFDAPEVSQHLGIEITPELREQILNDGLPHFHEGGEVDARTVKRGKIKPIDLETEFKLSKFKE